MDVLRIDNNPASLNSVPTFGGAAFFKPDTMTSADISWIKTNYVVPILQDALGSDWYTDAHTEWDRIVALRKWVAKNGYYGDYYPYWAYNSEPGRFLGGPRPGTVKDLVWWILGGTTTATSIDLTHLTVSSTTGLAVGMYIITPGAGYWRCITSISGTTLTLNKATDSLLSNAVLSIKGTIWCTSYATIFRGFLTVLGIPHRLMGTTDVYVPAGSTGAGGDDNMEVWSNDYGKWVMCSPIYDCCLRDGTTNIPLSGIEIYVLARQPRATANYVVDYGPTPCQLPVTPVVGALDWDGYLKLGHAGEDSGVNTFGAVGATRMFSHLQWNNNNNLYDTPYEGGVTSSVAYKAYSDYTLPYYVNYTASASTEFIKNDNRLRVAYTKVNETTFTVTLSHNMETGQFLRYEKRVISLDGTVGSWATVTTPHTLTVDASVAKVDFRAVNKMGY